MRPGVIMEWSGCGTCGRLRLCESLRSLRRRLTWALYSFGNCFSCGSFHRQSQRHSCICARNFCIVNISCISTGGLSCSHCSLCDHCWTHSGSPCCLCSCQRSYMSANVHTHHMLLASCGHGVADLYRVPANRLGQTCGVKSNTVRTFACLFVFQRCPFGSEQCSGRGTCSCCPRISNITGISTCSFCCCRCRCSNLAGTVPGCPGGLCCSQSGHMCCDMNTSTCSFRGHSHSLANICRTSPCSLHCSRRCSHAFGRWAMSRQA